MEITEDNKDLICGVHSIYHAIKNDERSHKKLFVTAKSITEFRKKYNDRDLLDNVEVIEVDLNQIHSEYKKRCDRKGFKHSRLIAGLFLECTSRKYLGNAWAYEFCENSKSVSFLALDQVTDVQNAAAIMRTCAFYKVDALIVGSKSSFALTPKFFQIASGAFEHVHFVQTPKLSKTLSKLSTLGVQILGLSEEAEVKAPKVDAKKCLVLGSEEKGLSNAVERVVKENISLGSSSEIHSLNVSVAAAVSLERFSR